MLYHKLTPDIKKDREAVLLCPFHQALQQLLFNSIDADLFAVFAHSLELHFAVDFRKQGVVGTSAYILAGVNVRAALFDEDVARQNELTVRTLYAESFGFGVTTVFGRAHTFFMREKLNVNLKHYSAPLSNWI